MSVNKVMIVGRVGQTPEIRRTNDGGMIANLSLATSEKWRDKATGERKESTQWHRVVVFNEQLAKVVESYVRKGSRLYVEGALQTRKWTDKDGVERAVTEIVLQKFRGEIQLLDGKDDGDDAPAARPVRERPNGLPTKPRASGVDLDDEVPFAPEFR
jgi:single-strand DNA-binding protein